MTTAPTSEEILKRTRTVVAKELCIPLEKVQPSDIIYEGHEGNGASLGADSLDLAELVMALEDEFDVDIMDEDITSAKTVQDYADVIGENISYQRAFSQLQRN